jgi:hypothetical protein
MAAWWVVLPVDFNALYEVHIFAILPMLAALLVIAVKPGSWGRGWGIAILLASTVLVRNEQLFAAGGLAALSLGWEWMRRRRGERGGIGVFKAYAAPLLLSSLAILLAFTRSGSLHDIRQTLDGKDRLNMCQAYAVSYQQRDPEWAGSPWTDCGQLMTSTFGKPGPTFGEAMKANRWAMLEHFSWNARSIPNCLQVLLFYATPAIMAFYAARVLVVVLSALVGAILIAGGMVLYRERDWRLPTGQNWVWIGMLLLALMALVVAVVERPWPEYMYSLGILVRAAVGVCLVAIAGRLQARAALRKAAAARRAKALAHARRLAAASKRRRPLASRAEAPPPVDTAARFGFVFPAGVALAILLAPMYYVRVSNGRPVLEAYRRLQPYQKLFERPHTRFVSVIAPDDLCNYLGKSASCGVLSFIALRNQVLAGTPWNVVLDRNGATIFFANEDVMADPVSRDFVDRAAQWGWRTVAAMHGPTQNWKLLAFSGKTGTIPSGAGRRRGKDRWDCRALARGCPPTPLLEIPVGVDEDVRSVGHEHVDCTTGPGRNQRRVGHDLTFQRVQGRYLRLRFSRRPGRQVSEIPRWLHRHV